MAFSPELHQINDDSYPLEAQHQKFESLPAAKGIQVIDLHDRLKDHGPKKHLWDHTADGHPNGKTNILIAKQLRDWIRINSMATRKSAPNAKYQGGIFFLRRELPVSAIGSACMQLNQTRPFI